ncbi:MarR family winged helix-turn-helix transcriptional regulator [Numidum massiliense]|uniref:MarR family winged helix-turn-helix transcriptional regulator n=1 Tax=Numidum massiliense TaxID=1522315 RepID=UPI0006D57C10|nr:MarR family transcriptional regulator [Numidum massiliense]
MEVKGTYSPEQVAQVERVLRTVSTMVKQRGRDILNGFPLTPPQFSALLILGDEGPMTTGELSKKMYLACSTTTDLLDRMERNGLVERVRSSKDRRVVKVHILEKGKAIILDVLAARRAYLQTILEKMSAREVEQLDQSLRLLARHMDGKPS